MNPDEKEREELDKEIEKVFLEAQEENDKHWYLFGYMCGIAKLKHLRIRSKTPEEFVDMVEQWLFNVIKNAEEAEDSKWINAFSMMSEPADEFVEWFNNAEEEE